MEGKETIQRKMIVFQLNDEEYAVDVGQIGSIERMMAITRVPHTKDYVKGVINLRGVVTPVIDLRTRFGIDERETTSSTRILIVHVNDIEVGLIVDSANDVLDIAEDRVESNPEVIGSADVDYIEGVVKVGQRLLILLDLHKVLHDENTEEIVEG